MQRPLAKRPFRQRRVVEGLNKVVKEPAHGSTPHRYWRCAAGGSPGAHRV